MRVTPKTITAMISLLLMSTSVLAGRTGILHARASTSVDPNDVKDTKCIDEQAEIDTHDMNVAQLAICGSIAGAIQKCQGSPKSSEGTSGTASFKLEPAIEGETIKISKGRWERCIRAARATCPTGTFSSTCIGGATNGDINFSLSAVKKS
ncbi:hypothetical protein K3495_g4415 [Podosphaera aphanis]|nr:hypothetical protein K3495_g4415 [Podosphaera aphanis]